jgi:hypothetical protein
MITLHDYIGPWDECATGDILYAAKDLLERVNVALQLAVDAGVDLHINPKTGTYISGTTLGGLRPTHTQVGAAKSSHKEGRGIDIYDIGRRLAQWFRIHQDVLAQCGLYMEHPSATATADGNGWCHLTTRSPGSGNRIFYP